MRRAFLLGFWRLLNPLVSTRSCAVVHPWDPQVAAGFNAYARTWPKLTAIDPLLVRLTYGP